MTSVTASNGGPARLLLPTHFELLESALVPPSRRLRRARSPESLHCVASMSNLDALAKDVRECAVTGTVRTR